MLALSAVSCGPTADDRRAATIEHQAPHTTHRAPNAAGLVPWRDPAGDLAAFFPDATGTRSETRILSHLRLELSRRLGYPPTGEELILRYDRVLQGSRPIGTVVARRVKGEYGAIELVLATTPTLHVRGVRLQRLREPDRIAVALTNPKWLGTFAGKTDTSQWQVGHDLAAVPPEARRSARAIADGVRVALVLLRAAERERSEHRAKSASAATRTTLRAVPREQSELRAGAQRP
jgi:hypothetical protein